MKLSERFREVFGKEKSKQELDEHFENIELEKGDFFAMLMAAFATFLPVLIIALIVIFGGLWLIFLR